MDKKKSVNNILIIRFTLSIYKRNARTIKNSTDY